MIHAYSQQGYNSVAQGYPLQHARYAKVRKRPKISFQAIFKPIKRPAEQQNDEGSFYDFANSGGGTFEVEFLQ
jgi:hypothetical protein